MSDGKNILRLEITPVALWFHFRLWVRAFFRYTRGNVEGHSSLSAVEIISARYSFAIGRFANIKGLDVASFISEKAA